ncbi:MAG: DUF1933 domain-containing protein [Erysipelotrichia bacterium]|nr:DUF1933 domain-containing protein [Erysipelotrichia bacterium]
MNPLIGFSSIIPCFNPQRISKINNGQIVILRASKLAKFRFQNGAIFFIHKSIFNIKIIFFVATKVFCNACYFKIMF